MRSFLVPFLLAVSAVSASQPEPERCGSNSECLTPLRKPARRWQSKRGAPTTSFTGLFQLDLQGSALSESATLTNGIYESINSGSTLEVTVTYPAGATTPQSGLNLVIVDPATNGQYLALSPESGDGSGVSSSTADSLVLIGASATTLPGALPDNTIASTLGSNAYLETAVWTFDPTTYALSASWTRSLGTSGNETVPLSFMVTEGKWPSPYLTGSPTAFNSGLTSPYLEAWIIIGLTSHLDTFESELGSEAVKAADHELLARGFARASTHLNVTSGISGLDGGAVWVVRLGFIPETRGESSGAAGQRLAQRKWSSHSLVLPTSRGS
ncbi:hypothetical protein JCM24511_04162 [Saitozyma sp. JCM 24511]|nr:hypothetical protein JCM24511_04162 [Saitozyma sp. JCM 24511]